MKKAICLIVIVVMLVCLTACASPVVGSWNTTIDGLDGQMTLAKDGTGTIVSNGISRPCTWEIKDDRLSVVQIIDGSNYVFLDNVSYTIEKDTLTVTSFDGSKTLTFTKD